MRKSWIAVDYAFVAVVGYGAVSRTCMRAATWLALAFALFSAMAPDASASKAVDSTIGTASGTPALGGTFKVPTGLAVNQSTARLYVVDRSNNRVQRFRIDDNGTPGREDDTHVFELSWGWDVIQSGAAGDQGTGFEICTVASDCQAGVAGTGAGQFASSTAIQGIAVDQSSGDVYVTDTGARRIQKFSADGQFERTWGKDVDPSNVGTGSEICVAPGPCQGDSNNDGSLAGEFRSAANNVAVDGAGNVYVGEGSNRRIQKFDSDGNPLRLWGWDVVASGPGNQGGDNEQQVVTLTGATGGSFTLTFDGETTAPIAYNADASAVQGALLALPNISPDELGLLNVVVTGAPGGPWTVTFSAEMAHRDYPQMTVNSAGLAGASASGAVTTTTDGASFEICVPANGDVCKIGVGAGGGEGTFFLGTRDPGKFARAGMFLATDASNRVYASDPEAGRVQRFESDGTSPTIFVSGQASDQAQYRHQQIAIDRSDGHVYLVKATGAGGESQVQERDASGALVDTHAIGAGLSPDNERPLGIALQESAGRVYLSTTQFNHWVIVLDDDGGPGAAEVVIQPPTDVTESSATLRAEVNPKGFAASYRFELSTDGVNWSPVGAYQSAGSGNTPVPVSAEATGLQANTLYHVRVHVTSFIGSTTSAATTFMTDAAGPNVITGGAQRITDDSAEVRGRINPNNLSTDYYVEYGLTSSYGSQTSPASAGSGGIEERYVVGLQGLQAGTTYHYRFVATNSEGTVSGEDRTFTTRDDTAGPLDRAYEMVTPPDKSSRRGGNDLRVDSPLVGTPSADGDSLMFAIRFGVLDSEAGTALPHAFDPVLIRRNPDGWRGEALNNIPPDAPSVAGLTNAVALSDDLEVQAWQHNEWLFPSRSMLGTRVFGDDGGDVPGSGWYDWLGDPAFATGEVQEDAALIASAGSHMVRWGGVNTTYRGLLGPTPAEDASRTQLSGAEGGDAVYLQTPAGPGARDLVNECTGTGAEATVIPMVEGDGDIGGQPCETGSVTSKRGATGGGGGDGLSAPVVGTIRGALSEDGRRVLFTSPDPYAPSVPSACSSSGATTDCPPQIYVRQYDAGVPTVRWISQSAVANQDAALLGRGTGFEGASADGGVVYFKTNAPLTPDDPNGGVTPPPPGGVTTGSASDASWDLYRYETPDSGDPGDGTLTRISGGPDGNDADAGGDFDPNVINASSAFASAAGALRFVSSDGEKAYFVTRGVIGEPTDPWNAVPQGGGAGPTGDPATTATRNLYLFDSSKSGSERWKFVARIPYSPSSSGLDGCASHFFRSGMPQGISDELAQRTPVNCVRGTRDGSVIAFESSGHVTTDDDDTAGDVFVYEAARDRLTRVSAPSDGQTGYVCADTDGRCNATLGRMPAQVIDPEAVGLTGAQNQNLAVDADGAVSVFFESRLSLVSEDTNGTHMDVYQWRAGELSLVSPGSSNDGAHFSGNSIDGEDVFFSTSERIDPREIDDDFDVYDARIGGGIPLPSPPPPPCDPLADMCQGGGSDEIDTPTESDAPGGGGNVDPGPRTALRVTSPGPKARRRMARTGVVRLRVTATGAGDVKAVATARVRKRRKAVTQTVGRGALEMPTPGTRTLKLRLSGVAMRQLRARRLSVTVKLRQAGTKTRTISFVLRRAGR